MSDHTEIVARVRAELVNADPYAMAEVGAVPTHKFLADLRALCTAVETLTAEVERLRGALEGIARTHELGSDIVIHRADQAYAMRCSARRALGGTDAE